MPADDLQSTVEDLRTRLDSLEKQLSVSPGEVRITCGDSSIRMTPIGIEIKADGFLVRVAGNSEIKSGGNFTLSADRIFIDRIDASDELSISCGDSSIQMKKDGSTRVRAGIVDVVAERNAEIKAAGNLVLKGGRIIEN